MTKAEENLMWSELVPDNKFGEQILDPELVQEIHSRLGHLCSDKWVSGCCRSDVVTSVCVPCVL